MGEKRLDELLLDAVRLVEERAEADSVGYRKIVALLEGIARLARTQINTDATMAERARWAVVVNALPTSCIPPDPTDPYQVAAVVRELVRDLDDARRRLP